MKQSVFAILLSEATFLFQMPKHTDLLRFSVKRKNFVAKKISDPEREKSKSKRLKNFGQKSP